MKLLAEVYCGTSANGRHCGSVQVENAYCIFEARDSSVEEDIRTCLTHMCASHENDRLHALSEACKKIKENNQLNSHLVIWHIEDALNLCSHDGAGFLVRDEKVYKIVHGTQTAHGIIQENDRFIFTTGAFSAIVNSAQFDHITPLSAFAQQNDNTPGVGLSLKAEKDDVLPQQSPLSPFELSKKALVIPPLFKTIKQHAGIIKKVIFVLIVLAVTAKLFTTIKNAMVTRKQQNYTTTLSSLTPRVSRLENSLFENPENSLKQLNELKEKINILLKNYPQDTKLVELQKKLTLLEKTMGKGSAAAHRVFFDLKLIDDKATAVAMSVSREQATLLDTVNKKIYTVSLPEKQHGSFSLAKLTHPTLFTAGKEEIFVLDTQKGIYRITADSSELIIPYDKTWGEIIDMKSFNSNIYLLDKKNDEIYKYVPIDTGYSEKTSYFKSGSSLDLQNSHGMSIDFSIYILMSNGLYKYTGGVRENFPTDPQLPYENTINIYHDAESEKLYVLDPVGSRVITINKNGLLQSSLFNQKLKGIKYFGSLPGKEIIFLSDNKIYLLDKAAN